MIRRFGEVPAKGQSYRPRPGVYAILEHRSRILLTHQATPHPEYQLPGGGIDEGEAPLPALHREVFEETGYTLSKPRRIGAFRRFAYMPEYDLWAEKLCHIYLAQVCLRLSAPPEDGHTTYWTTPERARDLLGNPGDRHFMTQYIAWR